jgi:lipoprotein-releasing system permease protein
MFELRTALTYLLPKKGQMSVSVVGLIAVLVVQAITWLVLVFFSTTEGFESRWTEKIAGVLGPLRVTIAPGYFESPYHRLDLYSSESGFQGRRLSKRDETHTLVYRPLEDSPLPQDLQAWYSLHGQDKEPVFLLTEHLNEENIRWRFFESTVGHISIPEMRAFPQKSLSQYTYLIGYDSFKEPLKTGLSELSPGEVDSLLLALHSLSPDTVPLLKTFVSAINSLDVIATKDIEVPGSCVKIARGTILKASITFDSEPKLHIELPKNHLSTEEISFSLQQKLPPISVVKVSLSHAPMLLEDTHSYARLPFIRSLGYPLILPKVARQQGVRFFDKGSFQCSSSPENGGVESLSLPFYVAGFYDPGILPTGGKLAITSRQAILAIHPELSSEIPFAPSGVVIDVDMNHLAKTEKFLKRVCEKYFKGLFVAEAYDHYEVTAELYKQFKSEKLLFRLISLIILAVACSNIFSMLFILAHDRRKEIAVLRALGASSLSIMRIFLLAGFGVGLIGSLCGAVLACLTLHYLPEVLSIISSIQGHELLQKTIYGDIGSQQVSVSMLLFTLASVSLLSAFAGGCAAVRACRINVSESLKAGG